MRQQRAHHAFEQRTAKVTFDMGPGAVDQVDVIVWSNIGAGMVIGGMAAAFFLDKPQGTWTKIGIAIAGLVLGWVCYSIASNILTYMHTAPEERH
jgi:hypothetical protein